MEAFNLTPSALESVIFYLLPGFILIFLFYYQIPDRKKSDFTVVIWSVVASYILNWATVNFFGLLNIITNLKLGLTRDILFFPVIRMLLGIIGAVVLAKIVKSDFFSVLNKKILDIHVYPFGRLWNDFFRLPENSVAKIFLNNGLCYIGVIKRTSVDPNDDVQEIELWKPLYYDSKKHRKIPIKETQSVLIQTQSIVSVELIDPLQAKILYPGLKS